MRTDPAAGVAQLVEQRIVIPRVAGSSPVTRPIKPPVSPGVFRLCAIPPVPPVPPFSMGAAALVLQWSGPTAWANRDRSASKSTWP